MTWKRLIGPIKLQFRDADGRLHDIKLSEEQETIKRVSPESEVIEGQEVPTWVELTTTGGAEPDRYIRVELRGGSPQVVELRWTSQPHQNEISPKHLRQTDLAKLATDLVASVLAMNQPAGDTTVGEQFRQLRQQLRDVIDQPEALDAHMAMIQENKRITAEAKLMAQTFIERQRRPRERRVITDNFLKSVAEVYRANIDRAPTKAVAKTFNVEDRMASTYVQLARRAGHLPPTKQGQKKA